ncbi:MAG TPA: hypothetical protein VGT41_04690 [Candidatus Babeliales bacterium]|nr:hypothetical protein [Candidatus Babeliales bacterium]
MMKRTKNSCNSSIATLLLFAWATSISPHIVKKHDPTNPTKSSDKTFDFSVQQYITRPAGDMVYVAAHPATKKNLAKEYSITALSYDGRPCFGLMKEKVTIDGEKDQKNPLHDTGIAHLALVATQADVSFMSQAQGNMFHESLLAVPADAPSDIYFLETIGSDSLYVTRHIKDAFGIPSTGIVRLLGSIGDMSFCLAAVKSSQGEFGQPGGGIAVINIYKHVTGTGSVKKAAIWQLDAQLSANVPRAYPIDCSTKTAKIGNDLSAVGSVIDMHWDAKLKRLYVALQVTAGPEQNDGARALLVGAFTPQGALIFVPIAPDHLFTSNNHIIGTRGAEQSVSLHHVRTFWPTSHLPYLLVVGGNGTPQETKNQLYSLPLVDRRFQENSAADNIAHGTLACKSAIPQELFAKNSPKQLIHRAFLEPAKEADDMYTTDAIDDNSATRVGNGPLTAGTIDAIEAHGDSVFVLVSDNQINTAPGIYYSQAIFDKDGKIAAWSSWKRAAHPSTNLFGFTYHDKTGIFCTLQGTTKQEINTIAATEWGKGHALAPLQSWFSSSFPQEQGGVFGLFEFPHTITPGIATTSLLIATGRNKVACITTESNHNTKKTTPVIEPDTTQYLHGLIDRSHNNTITLCTGGALNQIGDIYAAEIGWTPAKGGLLFVAGEKGVAILTDQKGKGWQSDLQTTLNNLTDKLEFKIISNEPNVKKLIFDNGYLYILTPIKLERIHISSPDYSAATIAQISQKTDRLNDVIVSNSYILLATKEQLLETTITNESQPNWSTVSVPYKTKSTYHLTAITTTGREQDLAYAQHGMVYAMSKSAEREGTALSRFAIKTAHNKTTASLIRDSIYNNELYPLYTFTQFNKSFTTDGALYLHAVEKSHTDIPGLKLGLSLSAFYAPIDIQNTKGISHILRSEALGTWIAIGDFGIRVNE